MEHRPLSEIAYEIRQDWQKVNYAAVPYLEAMSSLNQITDSYGFESGKSIVLYFLGNARTWKGDKAREIKTELKKIAGV